MSPHLSWKESQSTGVLMCVNNKFHAASIEPDYMQGPNPNGRVIDNKEDLL